MNLHDSSRLAPAPINGMALAPQGGAWPFMDQMPPEPPNDPRSQLDWAGYWRSVWKRRRIIALIVAVVTGIAMLYAHSLTPVFRSTTTILIESSKAKILSIEDVYSGATQDREYYQTQVEILRSRDVALRTVIATKLWDEPEFDPRKPTSTNPIARFRAWLSPPYEPPVWNQDALAEATLGKFLAAVSIEPVRLSQLVKISFDSSDRKLAARMADGMANAFIDGDREARVKLNVTVNEQLTDRLASLRETLLQSEQKLQSFREQAGLTSTSGGSNIATQQMTELSQRLVMAQLHRSELEAASQQGSGGGNGGATAEARNRVAAATAKVDELTQTRGDNDARVIEARSALRLAKQQLSSEVGAGAASFQAQLRTARAYEASVQADLAKAQGAVQKVNRQEFELGTLERDVQTNKQLYDLLLSRAKETGVSTNLQGAVARIVDAATPGAVPLSPNKPRIVMVALMLALTAAALAFILFDHFKRTVQAVDEAEHRLRHRVLASLPEVRGSGERSMTRLFLEAPKSQHATGIRHARTTMLMSNLAASNKMVLVTSAVHGEGKTTFCTNLAFAHAQSKRTLLIDCDLRTPKIGVRLGLPANALGLSDFVQGTADLQQCLHAVPGSALLVMPAGTAPVEPDELLLSPIFIESLRSLANRVDVVLIDSPPVNASSDALIIAQQVHDVIYVVKAGETPRLQSQRGLDRLRQAGASILGLVLTNTTARGPQSPFDRIFADREEEDEQQPAIGA